ncbi:MAG TPA: Ig-like domain-containing protein [Polyangia bacterium]
MSEPAGPAKLVRIMVQDATPFGVRGVAMDLLDTPGSPLTTAVACDAGHPCEDPFLLQHVSPEVMCTQAGTCSDPIAAGLAPLTPPETHRTGEAGGTQLRLVFDKLLAASIMPEMVLEIDDASGAPVDGVASWDPGGSPTFSSDLLLVPYGPALVFKPNAPLDASASYTINVNAALVTDRNGDPMADQNGVLVGATYSKTFATENLLLLPQTTPTNIAGTTAVTLTPDEIVQLGFNAPATSATVCTASASPAPVTLLAYADAGADAANCAAADATLVNLVAVDGTGAPTDWPAGDYTISCSVVPAGGGDAITVGGSFSVAGTAQPNDPLSRTQHVVCP